MEGALGLPKIWLPYLILVGSWIFAMNKYSGGTPVQRDSLEPLRARTEAQKQSAQNLERIATALERRP